MRTSVEIDGLSIAYERAGTGPPVVLLHGYVGDARSTWRHQIDDLSTDFSVVAWDAPGAGQSSDPPEAFGIFGYADCLARFIDALHLGPAHIIGLSFGGALAIAFNHRHKSLVRTLVLASAYAGWRGSLAPEAAEGRLAQAVLLSQKSSEEFVETLLPTMFELPLDEQDHSAFRASLADYHPSGFRAMASASAEDLRGFLSDITARTLLVYGSRDARAPLSVADALHRSITPSELVVLEGAGHVCNLELPRQFNEVVRTFLQQF